MTDLPPETYRAVLEGAPMIITIIDREGTILFMNKEVAGLPPEVVVGQSQYDFVIPEYRQEVEKTTAEVFSTGKPGGYQVGATSPGEPTRWYSTFICPLKRDGKVVAAGMFTDDVTEQRTTADELQKAKDELIAQQSRAIQELSTPVIEVAEDILVLPLIGAIDTARAQRVVESLLETIVEKQASVVIMDITGVPLIDTAVANHLITTVSAVAILGTRMILTGVSPHNAQTLVKLGVDLGAIITKSSLRAGLKHAFQLTGRRLVHDE